MFKTFPELETMFDKTADFTKATLDYQANLFTNSLDYFNAVTDKMFYTYTVSTADAVNKATEYAKENITANKKKVSTLFGFSK